MVSAAPTFTVAVASGIDGSALAWMTADPPATPLTRMLAEVVLAGNVTVAGTVATAGLSELKLTVKFALKGADRISVRNCEAPWPIDTLPGEKLKASVTDTVCAAGA